MIIDETTRTIWFRQSWLETAQTCSERARLAIVKPEFDTATSDLALVGTAAHAAIEQVLNGTESVARITKLAKHAATELAKDNDINWTKLHTVGELQTQAAQCVDAWADGIYPLVPSGGLTEHEFKLPWYTRPDGWNVGITGTIDYVPVEGAMWDWKTASRNYDHRAKQRLSIQATVYTLAAIQAGLRSEWPIHFKFGVMVRGAKKATPQICTVLRHEGHAYWLRDNLDTWVDMYLQMGVDRPWPRDPDHYLCNEVWCPWWSICRGARINTSDDRWTP